MTGAEIGIALVTTYPPITPQTKESNIDINMNNFSYEYELKGIKEENWVKYFTIEPINSYSSENDNEGENLSTFGTFGFRVKNLKACNRGSLLVTVKYIDVENNIDIKYDCDIKLSNFYE